MATADLRREDTRRIKPTDEQENRRSDKRMIDSDKREHNPGVTAPMDKIPWDKTSPR
ncbi:hypothetical protein [Oceanospirillum sediminis]|uniref:Uncharacterized protein n=1 Tax=Oceanospirillum sediminis TaxID=2760088 RepID=A0A839ISI3_9GAMM|nr:hypothetical protein [Oceanospirillum sediminis]MBB1487630.1 hypothetical protein [Oceanospirillum sediminis]